LGARRACPNWEKETSGLRLIALLTRLSGFLLLLSGLRLLAALLLTGLLVALVLLGILIGIIHLNTSLVTVNTMQLTTMGSITRARAEDCSAMHRGT